MKIKINDHRKIFAIQEAFQQFFPRLRIEFLAKPSKVGNPSAEKAFMESSKTLGDSRVIHTKGELTLSSGMTVADLKEAFRDTYGLSISILRKVGSQWMETDKNGSLSLEEQNQQ
jgi:hypothetical protein